jgi:hypothetical protein
LNFLSNRGASQSSDWFNSRKIPGSEVVEK